MDGAGVAGHGLNIASEFVPDEYGQGMSIVDGLKLFTCGKKVTLFWRGASA